MPINEVFKELRKFSSDAFNAFSVCLRSVTSRKIAKSPIILPSFLNGLALISMVTNSPFFLIISTS